LLSAEAEDPVADDPEVAEGRRAGGLPFDRLASERVGSEPVREGSADVVLPVERPLVETERGEVGGRRRDDPVRQVADPDRLAIQLRPPVAGSTGRSLRPFTRKIRPDSAEGGTPSAARGRAASSDFRPQRRRSGIGKLGSAWSPVIR
jgi:hypothetical protein